jgi:hypothetical protein
MTTEEFWQCAHKASDRIYTKDEFIAFAKEVLKKVETAFNESWKTPVIDFDLLSESEIEKMPTCPTCNGMLYYESGGNIEECTRCVEGIEVEPVFDSVGFSDKMEKIMMEGDSPFLELIYADVTDYPSKTP